MDLGQIFENNFDCYADVDKTKAALPNWYEDKDTMAMTKDKFIEVVIGLLSEGDKKPNENSGLHLQRVMPRIVLTQEWEESTDDKTGWSGSGWNEPEGYQLEEVIDYDKYSHALKAIFVYGA